MQDTTNKQLLEKLTRAVNDVERSVGFLPGRYDYDNLVPPNREYYEDIAIAVTETLASTYGFATVQQMLTFLEDRGMHAANK